MPPKRLAYAQGLRDAFTESHSCAVVERWATETIPRVEQLAHGAAAGRAAIAQKGAYTRADAEQTPGPVLSVLREYQAVCHNVFHDAEAIRTVIAVRVPELKEEDNLGVAVQHAVLRLLDDVENKTLGAAAGGNSGGERSSGVRAPTGVYALQEYLAARSEVEEKLLGDSAKGKEEDNKGSAKGGHASPSMLLKLQQVDADALMKVELAAVVLLTTLRSFVNAYALNWRKLIEPRTSTDRMVS